MARTFGHTHGEPWNPCKLTPYGSRRKHGVYNKNLSTKARREVADVVREQFAPAAEPEFIYSQEPWDALEWQEWNARTRRTVARKSLTVKLKTKVVNGKLFAFASR